MIPVKQSQSAVAPSVAADGGALTTRPRLGFVGLGWIGRMRLKSVCDGDAATVAAILDSDSDVCFEAGREHDCAVCASLDELLEQELDGVVIATPNACHADQAVAALERNLPVFCQKPLATTFADAQRVVSLAESRNLCLEADLSYRHLRGVRRAMELVSDGALGEIFALDLTFHNAYGPDKPWFYDRAAAGGGCLLDLGVHLLDLAQFITASPLECAEATLRSNGLPTTREQVEDFAWAHLRTDAGAAVRVACSWNLHAGRDCVIAVDLYGTGGSVRISNMNGSFYDFGTFLCRGQRSECLSVEDGAWGGGALLGWIEKVGRQEGFDEHEGERHRGVMRLIEEIYTKGLSCTS